MHFAPGRVSVLFGRGSASADGLSSRSRAGTWGLRRRDGAMLGDVRWPSRVVLAAVLSGVPSTVHALLTRRDPLAATRAAATLLPHRQSAAAAHPPSRQESARGTPLISRYQQGLTILAGVAVHLGISAFWAAAIDAADRRRVLGSAGGAVAGLMIGLLDLEIIGRRHPAIQELPRIPQYLDHMAFGALVVRGRAGSGPTVPSTSGRLGRCRQQ